MSSSTPSPTSDPQLDTKMPPRPGSRLSTMGQGGRRMWQYPTWFRGKMLTARSAVHACLVLILLIGPWIDVGGHPAIFFDIPHRRAYLWGLKFFATDGYYLLFLFGTAIFSIFLFTALFGRAWCGWTCPQTVFLESVIRPIERLIEGNPSQRKRLDRSEWSLFKAYKKTLKYAAYLVVCGAIGTTAVAYFLGREGVFEAQADPLSHPVGTAIFIAITGLCFFDFAWFREQTCLVVCPYGRFQSVLLDVDSIGVGYDVARGEPRQKPKKSLRVLQGDDAPGDCVDCKRCVNVCPTGIDIRNGNQLECIQCMACIDACNDMMHKLQRKPGLIRLDSERVLGGGQRKIVRPRLFLYATLLALVLSAFAFNLSRREQIEINLGRQSGPPYALLEDGRLQNAFHLRISNKSDAPITFDVSVLRPSHAKLVSPLLPATINANDVTHIPIFVFQSRANAMVDTIWLRVRSEDDSFVQDVSIPFLTPDTNQLKPVPGSSQ